MSRLEYSTIYTRWPTLLSTNRFRRRNGGGEVVRRYNRRLSNDEANQGLSNGGTVLVQSGGTTPFDMAAYSIIAAR